MALLPAVALHDYRKLRAWREAAGLTREQVCVALTDDQHKLSFSWLTALEQGHNVRQPSVQLLTRLAQFYGHSPGELMGAAA
jgi:transcriptional regulator with XRE-family HTH domain